MITTDSQTSHQIQNKHLSLAKSKELLENISLKLLCEVIF